MTTLLAAFVRGTPDPPAPDHRPPAWPSGPGEQQTQAHLDIRVDDLGAETERARALRATVEEYQPQDDVRVLRDPHGHLFCLFLPGA
ncbi:VOC family protein [Streptomyces sp. NPDC004286]|uniref:VOC family protein n=1 Tax=Streptomyces sp. NPDC004286 TaxID=3364696 RepID=UPI0036817B98